MKFIESIIDKTLNIFFSKDKTALYVLGFFLLGFILRLINIFTMPVSVDASGHALMAINFIDSGKLATWNQSVGLWHFLTDFAYKLFGINDFASRIVALLFGSFSIIIMFLFVKEILGRKTGLIAAFLLAVSPFHITETVPEMDVSVMFFVLLSMFLFIKALKNNKKFYMILSGIFIGIGVLIKIYALLFIPVLLLYLVYYYYKYKTDKKEIRRDIVLFLIFAGIFLIVPLAYNYLLYTDKGFVDYLFTGIFGIGTNISNQYYSWVVPYHHEYISFFFGGSSIITSKLPVFIWTFDYLIQADILILILGLIGLYLMIRSQNKDYLILSLFLFFIVYLYMGSITGLMIKHFMFLLIFFIPFAAYFIEKLTSKINIQIILLVILIFQSFWLYNYTNGDYYEISGYNSLNNYKGNIPQDSLVILDGRIFRGQGTFIFSDKHYLEANYFSELLNNQEKIPGQVIKLKTYFIECASDDCGWGTIKDQPDYNKSMEELVSFFKNNSELVKKITSENGLSFNIYTTELNLKESTLKLADSTHIFWANPLGYDKTIAKIFDDYDINSLFANIVNKIAHLILYISVILALGSIILVVSHLIKENEIVNTNPCV